MPKSIGSENSFEVFEGVEDEREVLSGHRQQVGPVVASGGQHDVLRQVAELFAKAVEFKRLFIHQTVLAELLRNMKNSHLRGV